MELSEFVLRIAFLALPGLVASKMYRKLRGRGAERKTWQDFTEVLLFALVSYLLLAIALNVGALFCRKHAPESYERPADGGTSGAVASTEDSRFWDRVSVIGAVFDSKHPIDMWEVGSAALIGIVVAGFASFVHQRNLVMRFCRWTGVTRRSGDEDVWDFFLRSPSTDGWLFVRDHMADIIYYGAITNFSESERNRELVIADASVYSAEGELLYECKAVYVARQKHELTIELPDFVKLKAQQNESVEAKGDNGQ